MNESVYYRLTHYRLSQKQKRECLEQLERTIKALEEYKRRELKPSKITTLNKIIVVYSNLVFSKGA